MGKKQLHSKTKRKTVPQKRSQEKHARQETKRLRNAAKKHKALGIKQRFSSSKHTEVPNLCPFKKGMLEELQRKSLGERRERNLQRLENKKLRKGQLKGQQEQLVAPEVPSGMTSEEALVLSAQARQQDFLQSTTQQQEGGVSSENVTEDSTSRKTGLAFLQSLIESSDIVLEVLDARDPENYRSLELESTIVGQGKKLILVLNKIDLVPLPVVAAWQRKLSQEHPVVMFKCNLQQNQSNHARLASYSLFQNSLSKNTRAAQEALLKQSGAVGVNKLLGLIKNYTHAHTGGAANIQGSCTVGVVGYPNTGKSALINSLRRKGKAVGVSSTPGFTKHVQEIIIDSSIRILDSPGVIFDKAGTASLTLRNVLKPENMGTDYLGPIEQVLAKVEKLLLLQTYEIADFDSVNEFLANLARRRGKLKRHGVANVQEAARIVMQDWNAGNIPYFRKPEGFAEGGMEIEEGAVEMGLDQEDLFCTGLQGMDLE